MSSLTGFVKRIRDIMWNDAGVNGDAQRIEQMAWILFLKVYTRKRNGDIQIGPINLLFQKNAAGITGPLMISRVRR